MLKKTIKNKSGFTLLELVVAVAVFAVVTLIATQIFQMVMEGQRRAIASQTIQDTVRYIMEVVSKEVRMAKISEHDCESLFSPAPTAVNKVYNITNNGNDVLYFKNKNSECVAYYLSNNRLAINRSGTANFITPDDLLITNLNFKVKDDLIGAFHSVQPLVVIAMDAQNVNDPNSKIRIETTISSRYYANR